MKVWPALPAPGELVRLPLPCPPQLIELSGYTGGARLIALWWSPFGDELMISDGTLTETGRWRGWLCFSGHPLARLFLEPYRLGDSDDQGEHRLLVDRYLGTLEIGLARDVEQLLATQPSELHALTADLTAGETEALLQRLYFNILYLHYARALSSVVTSVICTRARSCSHSLASGGRLRDLIWLTHS